MRSRRRSSSVRPPQTPASWFVASANSRHSAVTGHCAADPLGRFDLVERDACRPDREEQLRTRVPARGAIAPSVRVPVVRSDPGQRHFGPPLGRTAPLVVLCARSQASPSFERLRTCSEERRLTAPVVTRARVLTRRFAQNGETCCRFGISRSLPRCRRSVRSSSPTAAPVIGCGRTRSRPSRSPVNSVPTASSSTCGAAPTACSSSTTTPKCRTVGLLAAQPFDGIRAALPWLPDARGGARGVRGLARERRDQVSPVGGRRRPRARRRARGRRPRARTRRRASSCRRSTSAPSTRSARTRRSSRPAFLVHGSRSRERSRARARARPRVAAS